MYPAKNNQISTPGMTNLIRLQTESRELSSTLSFCTPIICVVNHNTMIMQEKKNLFSQNPFSPETTNTEASIVRRTEKSNIFPTQDSGILTSNSAYTRHRQPISISVAANFTLFMYQRDAANETIVIMIMTSTWHRL